MTVKGLDGMTEMIALMQSLGATKVAGIQLDAKKDGKINNAEKIEYLAEPEHGPSRDIRLTDKDRTLAANAYLNRVSNVMRMISKQGRPYKRWDEKQRALFVKQGQKKAENANASGFRAAGKLAQKILQDRVESGGFEPPTNAAYATWRQNMYGIPKSVALKASGSLIRNLTGTPLTLTYSRSFLENISTKSFK